MTKARKKSNKNLKVNKAGRPTHAVAKVPAQWEQFACYLKLLASKARAAKQVGFHAQYGAKLADHPIIAGLVAMLDSPDETKWPASLLRAWKKACQRFYLTEELLDSHLMRVIESDEHERRGLADVVAGVKLGYERLNIIRTGNSTSFKVQANVSAQAAAGGSANAFEVYESEWLRRRKDTWQHELEGKHGTAEPTATRE